MNLCTSITVAEVDKAQVHNAPLEEGRQSSSYHVPTVFVYTM